MKKQTPLNLALALCASLLLISPASAGIGARFPSEKKIVPDPRFIRPTINGRPTANG
jgi:hypothetical protein